MENFIETMALVTKITQGVLYFIFALIGAAFTGILISEYKFNKDPKVLKLLREAWETIAKQESYIKQLEAQISRDRESLIKEGEFAKKYLGNQKEWINE